MNWISNIMAPRIFITAKRPVRGRDISVMKEIDLATYREARDPGVVASLVIDAALLELGQMDRPRR